MGARIKKGRAKGRRGKAPAPYTKYRKAPQRYSDQYYRWRQSIGRGNAS